MVRPLTGFSHPENTASGSVVQDLCDVLILNNIYGYKICIFQSNLSRIAVLAEVSLRDPSGWR
ncbi:MAG: hypothetical protein KAU44_01025, partial [Candidatus Marinimicrobia bacterium]|nr:hypothetical protein [Candidatus Neomarinimicrobiota bacterium]